MIPLNKSITNLLEKSMKDEENFMDLIKDDKTVEEYENMLRGEALIKNGGLIPVLNKLDEKIKILNKLVMEIRECPAIITDLSPE